MAQPEVGVVLNIGLTHVEKLGSIEAIAAEKLALPRSLPASGTAVLNADDERVRAVIPELACHVIAFGHGDCAALRWSEVAAGGPEGGTRFTVRLGDDSAVVESPVPGEHTVPGVVAAIGVALALGVGLGGRPRRWPPPA